MEVHKLIRYSGIALAVLAIASCKTLELPTKKIDYKSTSQLPPLEVPPDLTRPSGDDRFVVPGGTPKSTATYSDYDRRRSRDPQAVRTSVLPQQENARMERAGSQRWLVVRGEPQKLWLVVKDFWQETGFIINLEVPEAGVMETEWAENRAKVPETGIRGFIGRAIDSIYSTGERDKFRTRLERGIEPGSTEIYISHRGMEEVYTDQTKDKTRWQPRAPNPELEAEMLGRLMARLGVQHERVQAELAEEQRPARATLVRSDDGARMLSLNDQFDRAWRRVGLALDRVGFTVEDRDRSKGLYFVRYIDPGIDNQAAEEKGWLSKFMFWKSDKKNEPTERYRILVKDAATGSEVNVLNKEGTREQTETTARILSLLLEQLK